MSEQKEHFYEFGPFRIDAVKRRLLREDEPVPLKPKAFDTLLVLIQHSGQVMDKEELMKRLWPDSFVEEANLSVNISTLRKALGESPHEHRYIVTVPGRGYRFVADVHERRDEETELIVRERTTSEVIIEEETNTRDEAARKDVSPDTKSATGIEPNAMIASAPQSTLTRNASGLQYLTDNLKPHHRSARLALAALVIAGIVAAFLTYRLTSQKKSIAPFERVKLARLTTTGKAISADISPDGKFVAFVVSDAGQQSLWIRQVATTSNVQIITPSEVSYFGLTFSRDGNYVYYVRSESGGPSSLYRVPVLGGASIKLAEDVDTRVTLSPDGLRLAFVRGYPDQGEAALMIANADGGKEQRLVSFKGNPNYFILGKNPAWSPDGKRIACSAKNIDDRGEYHHLFEVEVESREIKPIGSRRWQQIGQAVWLADGRALIVTAADEASLLAQQIWRISYPGGEAHKISNDLNDYRNVSLTADSKTLITVQSDQQANIWVAPEAGDVSRAMRISSGNYDGVNGLAWTPDGKIIYTAQVSGNQNLWIADQDGSNQKQLTLGAGNNRSPSVSPDGRHVVFVSDRTGTRHLWRMSVDGSQPTQLTDSLDDDNPNFSPDGQWVVYKSYTFGNPNLLRVSIGGGSPLRLTDKISVKPAVSPLDGMIACFYRDPALSPNKLVLIPFEGGQPVKTLDIPFSTALLRWSTDGQALTYINTRGGVSNIWSQPLDGSPPKQLTDFKQERIFWFDWSRDGKALACARGIVTHDVVMISDLK